MAPWLWIVLNGPVLFGIYSRPGLALSTAVHSALMSLFSSTWLAATSSISPTASLGKSPGRPGKRLGWMHLVLHTAQGTLHTAH